MIKLEKGINLGGWFSQCEMTEMHYENFSSKQDIAWVAMHGFDHVRIPVDYEFFLNEKGAYIDAHFQKLHEVIRWCEYWDLSVVLDLHKAPGYNFDRPDAKGKDPLFTDRTVQKLFLELWRKLAEEYSSHEKVAFELLNEIVNPEYAKGWNRLLRRAVRTIRRVTKTHTIIYGGVCWNSAKTIRLLKRPHDQNIIWTFHYYEPLLFTHQKAYWVAGMDPDTTVHYPDRMAAYRDGSAALGIQGQAVLNSKLDWMGSSFHREFLKDVLEPAKKYGVRLYCGEMGVIDRAPAADTLHWYEDVTELFGKLNIGYACWTYKDMDFGISGGHYEPVRGKLFCEKRRSGELDCG